MGIQKNILLVLFAVLIFAVSRFIPHLSNFTALIAFTLFVGGRLASKTQAILLILCCLFLTDLYFGLYPGMIWNYGCLAVVALFSYSKAPSAQSVLFRSVMGCLAFYVVSNFGVWLHSGMYSMDFNGFVSCYVLALPFLFKTFGGTLFFTGLFFATSSILDKISSLVGAEEAS